MIKASVRKLSNLSTAKWILSALVVFSSGCQVLSGSDSSTFSEDLVYARDDAFRIVINERGESFDALSERYYGTENEADQIRALNPQFSELAGELVVIPTGKSNPTGISAKGYRMIPILCYHQFTAAGRPRHRLDLSAVKFRLQLQYLKDEGYQVLRLGELEQYLNGQRPMPSKAVVITIDDGYRSVYDVAFPILKEFNYPATMFVYTDFIGGKAALTWEQMKVMQDSGLISIQSHSKSHASLATPNKPDPKFKTLVAKEITIPNIIFSKKLGSASDQFSYPYGDNSDFAVRSLSENGFRIAVTVQRGGNPGFADPMRLRRAMVYSSDNLSSFKRKLQTFSTIQ